MRHHNYPNSRFKFQATSLLAAFALIFCSQSGSAAPSGFSDDVAYGNWSLPVGFTFDENGRQYVWEKNGRVWVIENDGKRLTTPLIDLSEEVGNWRDFGLLGFALDPNFLQNGYIYLFYVVDRHHLFNHGTSSYDSSSNEYFAATIGRITRYTANPGDGFNSVSPSSRKVLLGETKSTGVPILHQSHGTGSLVFGTDGSLIAATGDAASYSSTDKGSASETYYQQALSDGIIRPEENVGSFRSQMLGSLNGKILRLDPNTGDGLPSNPFFNASEPRSPQSRVWSLGLRNPSRISVRPDSGSTDMSAGSPGAIYIGDVGWSAREELNIADAPAMNFGWPIFEGHENHQGYTSSRTLNKDVENPIWTATRTGERYLAFQDLIAQAVQSHNPSFPNPTNPSVQLPASVPKFMHARPALDYTRSSNDVRIGTYSSDGSASTARVGSAGGPSGNNFTGNCAIGGAWHSGVGFPESYGPSYYFADYGKGRIVRVTFSEDNKPQQVQNFHTNGAIVFLGVNPTDNSLNYINIQSSEIRKIEFTGDSNLRPKASFASDKTFGTGPLTVTFDATASSDPEGGNLTYNWSFGDGSTATGATTTHTFNASSNTPSAFNVTLTVTDQGGKSDAMTLPISLNNTPPTVEITGVQNGDRYDMDQQSTVAVSATVSDAEHANNTLDYEWQAYLYHGNHNHPEPIENGTTFSPVLTPTPKTTEFYAYRIRHKVTDPLGLATEVNTWLYPERDSSLPYAPITSPADGTDSTPGQPITVTAQPTGAVDRVEFYANGVPVGSTNSAPYSLTFTPADNGPVSIVTLAVSGFGSSVSDPILVQNGSVSGGGNEGSESSDLPQPWKARDIGNGGVAGSTTYNDATNTFTVNASGRDIWDTTDEFRFVYIPVSGEGEMTVELTGLTDYHPWAKAGLMIRSSLADNAVYGAIVTTPLRGSQYQWRPTAGETTIGRRHPLASNSRFLRIRRIGEEVSGLHSADGVNWTTIWFTRLELQETFYAGICLTSHIDDELATATFKNIQVTGFTGAAENSTPSVTLTSPANGSSFKNTDTVTLSANASDSDGSISKVTFYSGSTAITEITSAPYTLDTVFPVAGTYQITAVATDDAGATANSSTATITITEDQNNGGLPSGWTGGDIGYGAEGSVSFSAGVYTVRGSGADIWGSKDGFHFARNTLNGDGEIIARVLSMENTHDWAKAGVMIRDGADEGARYAAMLMTPLGRAAFQYRNEPGAHSRGTAQEKFTFPHWVRLVREGNTFTGYRSADGSSWTRVSHATVEMPDNVFVGLSVSSHDPSVTNATLFDNVSITGGTGASNATPSVALTSPSNGTTFTSTETVEITASASDTDGSIAKVSFFSGETLIGEVTSAPYEASAVFPVAGNYELSAVATDNLGATASTETITITIEEGAGTPPPSPWNNRDIGIVGVKGGVNYDNGLFTVKGSGADIWGYRDAFQFVYQPLNGDGEIVAKVSAFNSNHNWAKAGVMIRSSLADNATFGMMMVTPKDKGAGFIHRAGTAEHTKMRRHPLATAPRYVKLKREGARISAQHSADGVNWTTVQFLDIPMGANAYVGLAVTSHDNAIAAPAAFEHVSVTP